MRAPRRHSSAARAGAPLSAARAGAPLSAARAGAIIIVLCTLVASSCAGSGSHRSSGPTTTVPGKSPSGTVPPKGSLPGLNWSEHSPVPAPPPGPSSTISRVLAPATGTSSWIAVGTVSQPGAGGAGPAGGPSPAGGPTPAGGPSPAGPAKTTATVWTSPDGLNWAPTALPGNGPTQARGVVSWSNGYLVIGSVDTGSSEQAAVWEESTPSGPWQAVDGGDAFTSSNRPLSAPGNGQGAVMDHVAAGALGIFASGTIGDQQVVWYSSNGTKWSRLSQAEQAIDQSPNAKVNSLLVTSTGAWAAGTVSDSNHSAETDGAVWNSTDGIHWKQVPNTQQSFNGDGDHVINTLAAFGTGVIAVGGVRTGGTWMPASWVSPNGLSWSQASESFPQPGPTEASVGSQVEGVTAEPSSGQVIAVGGGNDNSPPHMWTSTDGLSWKEDPLPAPAATTGGWNLTQVAASPTATVVADNTVGAPRMLAQTGPKWTEVTANPTAFGALRPQVNPSTLLIDGSTAYLAVNLINPGQTIGSAQSSAEILTTTDGSNWTVAAGGPAFAGSQISDLIATPNGLLAVGYSTQGPSPAASSARVWTSPSGTAWSAAPAVDPATFTPPGQPTEGDAAARLGNFVVMVGRAPGGTPSALVGPGGQASSWMSSGGPWQADGSLDPAPGLGEQQPAGACSGPQQVVAVGSASGGGPGRKALAWSTTNGTNWRSVPISPAASTGERQSLEGCLPTGDGFLAYGGASTANSKVDPALWQSSGTTLNKLNVSAFVNSGAGSIGDVAVNGTQWLAVSGGNPTASPTPRAASEDPTAPGVWRSDDAGASWQRVQTNSDAWTGPLGAQATQAAWLHDTAILAGTVDGQLTIWTATPAA